MPDGKGKYLDLGRARTRTAKRKLTGEKRHFTVERVIWAQESNYPEKIIVLQELKWAHNNRTQLRFAYYTTSKKGNWWWGQFAVMISTADFNEIVAFAQEKGML